MTIKLKNIQMIKFHFYKIKIGCSNRFVYIYMDMGINSEHHQIALNLIKKEFI